MGTKYLGDQGPDGTIVGKGTSAKVGFFTTSATSRPSSASQAKVRTTALNTTATNVTNSTVHGNIVSDVNAVKVLLNKLRDDLVALGLIKGS